MVNNGHGSMNLVEHVGVENPNRTLAQVKGGIKGSTNNPFSYGDQMEYVGFVSINGTEVESQHIQQVQNESQNLTLQFDAAVVPVDGHPCNGAPTLTDVDGNVYNTVQIGNQCWMKENLRTTKYADNTSIPLGSTYSDVNAYRYCPDNNNSNVDTYGYLYNWAAVMHNSTPSEVQGVCPNGWHVPSDAEWTQLTDYVSSQNQNVCGSNNSYIAKALASTIGWSSSSETCAPGNNPSENNVTGFSAVPAGFNLGACSDFSYNAYFWSSTESSDFSSYGRTLYYDDAVVGRYDNMKSRGLSVRCLRN